MQRLLLDEEIDLDKISIGCLVRVLDVEYDEEEEYKLVGSSEASSLQNKISNESPFGTGTDRSKSRRYRRSRGTGRR